MNKALLGIALLTSAASAEAVGLDLALSEDTANLTVVLNPDMIMGAGGSELALGGFMTDERDALLHASLMARGSHVTRRTAYKLGVGIKGIAGDLDTPDDPLAEESPETSETVGAVGLGFQINLLVSPSPRNPAEISFEGYYAPSVTSFSDARGYSEFAARLQVEVMPQAQAYFGYRRLRFETDAFDNVRLDNGLHVGLKITY